MEYRKIKYLNKSLSGIVCGCAMVQMMGGDDASDILDQILGAGINVFDTAKAYGDSEVSLGKWLEKGSNRENAVVITKGCHHTPEGKKRVTPENFNEDIEQSLDRLKTKYIDIYLLHRDNLEVEVGPMVEVFNKYYREGKIKVCGVSNWTPERIGDANKYAVEHGLVPFSVSSPNYGLCRQVNDPWGHGCVTIAGAENESARKWYFENHIPVFAYSSLGRGFFSGKIKSHEMENAEIILDEAARKGYCYPDNFMRLERVEKLALQKGYSVPQIALAWILNQELNVFPIVTCDRPLYIEQAIASLDIKLTPDEVNWLDLR